LPAETHNPPQGQAHPFRSDFPFAHRSFVPHQLTPHRGEIVLRAINTN